MLRTPAQRTPIYRSSHVVLGPYGTAPPDGSRVDLQPGYVSVFRATKGIRRRGFNVGTLKIEIRLRRIC